MLRTLFTTLAAGSLVACHRGGSAPAPLAPAAALGVEWRVVSLGGQPVGHGANGEPLTLLLSADGNRASGYAGCNRFAGSYTLTGAALSFGPLAMTRMACEHGDVLERQYTQALAATTGLRITADGLELLKGSTPLATLTR